MISQPNLPPPASPFAFHPSQPIHTLGHFLGTPLAVQGWSWLPLSELITGAFFTLRSAQKRPHWRWPQHLLLGAARTAVFLGAEWCHNLAHVSAARAVGKPVDVMRILFGMPVLIYHEPEHPSVTHCQHIIRSLGGPLCNAVLLLVSKIFQRLTPAQSPAREIANTAVGMNTFIASAGLLPISAFDGGPILKWSLVGRGCTPAQAEQITAQASQVVGAGLLGSAAVALHKRRWLLAGILSFLGMISLAAPRMEAAARGPKKVSARTSSRKNLFSPIIKPQSTPYGRQTCKTGTP